MGLFRQVSGSLFDSSLYIRNSAFLTLCLFTYGTPLNVMPTAPNKRRLRAPGGLVVGGGVGLPFCPFTSRSRLENVRIGRERGGKCDQNAKILTNFLFSPFSIVIAWIKFFSPLPVKITKFLQFSTFAPSFICNCSLSEVSLGGYNESVVRI